MPRAPALRRLTAPRRVGADDQDACVVVLHGQPAVVLCALYFADVLALEHEATGDVAGAGQRAPLEIRDSGRR